MPMAGGKRGGSGVPFWKKMNYAINFRGVAYVPHIEFEFEEFFYPFEGKRERRTFREVVYQGLDS